ncbi:class I SAM-dependent methyltransferase [Verrucomicrobiota bacterium]
MDIHTREYYLDPDGCEGSREFLISQGEKLSGRSASVFAEIQNIDGGVFLNLGCGRGELSLHLKKKAKRVVSVDYSTAAIEISRKILGKAEVIQADIVEFLPRFETEPFDGILMIDIAEHLFDWELKIVFNNVARLLKPGGHLYIDTPISSNRSRYSRMHVNIKQTSTQYLIFLPGFTLEKEKVTDPRGKNHLIILRNDKAKKGSGL